jgi:hypothetical protein
MILSIGGLAVRIDAPPVVERCLEDRFRGFEGAGRASVSLRVATAGFRARLELDPRVAPLSLRREGARLQLGAIAPDGARGSYDLRRGEGWLEGVRHLGEIDALLRLALSIELPRRGALLVHGAAVESAGAAVVLVGASGAGKSTAAAALGALSDELTVIDVGALQAEGTPYWRGRARRIPIASLRVLERGLPARESVRGAEALRALLPHLVRYAALAEVDREQLALAARLCGRLPVERLRCPEGAAYLPFLRRALEAERAA